MNFDWTKKCITETASNLSPLNAIRGHGRNTACILNLTLIAAALVSGVFADRGYALDLAIEAAPPQESTSEEGEGQISKSDEKTPAAQSEDSDKSQQIPEEGLDESELPAPDDFIDENSPIDIIALPSPDCETDRAVATLYESVLADPMPTFDGISPWPGLFGYWIHQRAGIYATITGSYESRFFDINNEISARQKLLVVKLNLFDLCKNTVVGRGRAEFDPLQMPIKNIHIKLENHNLQNVLGPEIIIRRLAARENAAATSENLVGLQLKYRIKGSENGEIIEEAILLRNLLNP